VALIATGPFGTKRSFVPISAAGREDDAVTVPFDKARVDPDRTPSESESRSPVCWRALVPGSGRQRHVTQPPATSGYGCV
jgi:hypothetical protein